MVPICWYSSLHTSGKTFTRFWSMFVGICAHLTIRAFVRTGANVSPEDLVRVWRSNSSKLEAFSTVEVRVWAMWVLPWTNNKPSCELCGNSLRKIMMWVWWTGIYQLLYTLARKFLCTVLITNIESISFTALSILHHGCSHLHVSRYPWFSSTFSR